VPTRTWLIDNTKVELVDRGVAGITLRAGDFVTKVPPRTIGAWAVAVPGRQVHLEARRNLDVVRFFVFSDDHPVPRGSSAHRDATAGTACATHDRPAICRCARCDAASCRECAPDGHHCGACLWALFDEDNARIRRVRRWAVVGSLAAFAVLLALASVLHWRRGEQLGAGGIALTIFLAVSGWLAERRERRAGVGAAVDPRFVVPPEARVKAVSDPHA
jgi:hypothetical protein